MLRSVEKAGQQAADNRDVAERQAAERHGEEQPEAMDFEGVSEA